MFFDVFWCFLVCFSTCDHISWHSNTTSFKFCLCIIYVLHGFAQRTSIPTGSSGTPIGSGVDDTIVSGSLGTFTGARDMAWFEESGSKALVGINMVLAYTFHPHSFLS